MFGSVLSWAHFELDLMGLHELAAPRVERFVSALQKLEPTETTAAGWRHIVGAYRSGMFEDDPQRGLVHAESALAAFQLAGHPARELARVFIGLNAQALGAFGEAHEALQASRHADVGTVSSLRDFLRVFSLLESGEMERALRDALEMVERNRHRNPAERGRAHWAVGLTYLRLGDHRSAEREVETALANMGRWPAEHAAALLTRTTLWLATGTPERALPVIDEARRRIAELSAAGYRGSLLRFAPLRRAEVLHALGRHAEACAELGLARDRTRAVAARIEDGKYRDIFLTQEPFVRKIEQLAASWGVT